MSIIKKEEGRDEVENEVVFRRAFSGGSDNLQRPLRTTRIDLTRCIDICPISITTKRNTFKPNLSVLFRQI